MEWTIVGEISVDSANVALGDRQTLGADFRLSTHIPSDVFDLTDKGIQLIGCTTKEDAEYPIEVSSDGAGLRVEFVDDIPDVDGAWKLVGHLRIGTEGCLVCDPRCESDFYFVPIEMESGTYRVEVFEDSTRDLLGIRMLRTKTLDVS